MLPNLSSGYVPLDITCDPVNIMLFTKNFT